VIFYFLPSLLVLVFYQLPKKRGVKRRTPAVMVQQMTTLNKVGEELGKIKEVNAMTDITGLVYWDT
jgi:selenophosphate synthase